ncbi:RecQ family ATP-dependent DNA helicase [Lacimicrobium alkaliphilum]|uniref:ATP-dependent DNA helicase RecQ n=1 Tax=Lacimicrobium alkaliphilum TaxID=1526571 RepID=A0A0U2ZGH1_9ALTE|nr:RecQ family ATP-dependent DNA helicase [Lacimicrobium alkaliphilum]ALS98103.1 recombinase RecQ [Lacimicrobium alkaliphilum]
MYQQSLQKIFGFNQLRPGQQEVVEAVLNGQSAAAIFPTGSGKSLCYQLPALHLPHLTLVVSPLLALMQDQLSFLQQKGIAAGSIDSQQSHDQQQQVMADARSGKLKILMISVERLKNERFRHFIAQVPLSLLVVDEAHCISEWGHNFRPDYLKLPQYRQDLNIPQVLLLTATATPAVIEDMCSKFSIAKDNVVVTGFYRQNLDLSVMGVGEAQKLAVLKDLLGADSKVSSIVYVTLQHTAEQVAQQLKQSGIEAQAYHAGMDSERREQVQRDFMSGVTPCIVATIAFGMGIDKADIRRVIHFDLPKSIENYSQEIGRAGRDGKTAFCTVLANRSHLTLLQNFVYGDTPDKQGIALVLEQIKQQTGDWAIQLYSLSAQSNIRQLPLKTLLVYLQLQGVLAPKFSYFAEYKFKTRMPEDEIINRFEGERRQFVSQLFAASAKAKTWHSVDFDLLWQQYQGDRKRALTALEYFSDKEWIELQSSKMTEVYEIIDSSWQVDVLSSRLYALFVTRQNSEIKRIDAMLALFEGEQCLSQALARYFADEQAPKHCGHCSVCRGQPAVLPAPGSLPPLPSASLSDWCQPYLDAAEQLQKPVCNEALARFLCGIRTPDTTLLKAAKMPGFARLEAYPYVVVLEQVKQTMSLLRNQN